ncbi:thioredoxin-related transmembrane protein 2 [Cajanus cajan]|uniref:thioredoxin-related transmembrane protein 2 n=1 Tax=Cajanus cajan TaxID=3821 RepID=UPI0010FB16AA|nr:thioredoxin-related transmembrane protein 2 [Cajanus cajan]
MGKESSSSNSSNPVQVFQWLNRMVSEPYYLFHFLTFFSYLIVRSSATQVLAPHVTHHLLRREIQTLLVFALLALVKGVKEETWEAFIADALFLAKVIVIDVFAKLLQLPSFIPTSFPPSPFFHYYSQTFYLTLIFPDLSFSPSHYNGSTLSHLSYPFCWQVEFRASYSPACIRSSQQFPELSITYSSKKLAFGIVDVGLFPNAAEKFGISLSGSMGQLPTFILFENAAEVARFPELDFEATYFHPTITKGLLSRHFELDRYLLEYINGK